jgi:hypothetical protein
MQKINLVALFALLALCFNSCSKEHETEYKLESKKNQKNQVAIMSNETDRQEWSETSAKCIDVETKTCCLPPAPTPAGSAAVVYQNFLDAFNGYNNKNIPDFFTNYHYEYIWPDIDSETTILNGLKDGSNRIIKITNNDLGIDYFLVGSDTLTDDAINVNPQLVIYVER